MHILAKNKRHATETVGVVWRHTDTHTDRGPTAIIVYINRALSNDKSLSDHLIDFAFDQIP